jgi:hypothetical protein
LKYKNYILFATSIKSRKTQILIFFTFFNFSLASTQPAEKTSRVRDNFQTEVFKHIEYLTTLCVHFAGSATEKQTVTYIQKDLQAARLITEVESFEFDFFKLEKSSILIGGNKYELTMVAFNPYEGNFDIEGEFISIEPGISKQELFQLSANIKIILTTPAINYFLVNYLDPKAVVIMDPDDFRHIRDNNPKTLSIHITGKTEKMTAYNVTATIKAIPAANREIIISAHHDSYGDPGANDNGSGIGVLIALAKNFAD